MFKISNHWITLIIIPIYLTLLTILTIFIKMPKEYIIFGIILIIIFCLPLFIFKKSLFSKILIDSISIKTLYRGKIIKELYWKDVNSVQVGTNNFVFFEEKTTDINKNYLHSTYFQLTIQNAYVLQKYLNYNNLTIKNLEKLSKNIKNILTKRI